MLQFGEKVRKIREIKGLSQSQIETKTGLKREYLSKIENGDLKNPTLSTIQRLADGLGIKISAFFEEEVFKPKVPIIKIISGDLKRKQQRKTEEAAVRYISVPILESKIIAKSINYIDENEIKGYALIQSDCLEPTDDRNRYRCMQIKAGNENMYPVIRSNSLVCIDSHQRNPHELAGSIVVLRNEDGECLLTYLKVYKNNIVGIPENSAEYSPIVIPISKKAPVLGKVVWYSTNLTKRIKH